MNLFPLQPTGYIGGHICDQPAKDVPYGCQTNQPIQQTALPPRVTVLNLAARGASIGSYHVGKAAQHTHTRAKERENNFHLCFCFVSSFSIKTIPKHRCSVSIIFCTISDYLFFLNFEKLQL